jgi:hypothetical protein
MLKLSPEWEARAVEQAQQKAHEEAQAETERANREARVLRDIERREASKAREAAHHATRNTWIAEHGSPELRAAVQEVERGNEISSDAIEDTYRDERLAVERPGWRWEYSVLENLAECQTIPAADDWATLAAAREIDPDAALWEWSLGDDDAKVTILPGATFMEDYTIVYDPKNLLTPVT